MNNLVLAKRPRLYSYYLKFLTEFWKIRKQNKG